MKFRLDINAMRALAVGAVVLFHFDVRGFRGGFFGVDLFFVISGYLMTSIVLTRLREGRFSYLAFMYARVVRIVPALLVLVATLLALGAVVLPPNDLQGLALEARSALLFFSNVHFEQGENGYFGNGIEDRWLLHTWSLSAEWQFYLVYPLGLWLVSRWVRPGAAGRPNPSGQTGPYVGALVLTAAASFAVCCLWAAARPDAAFFLLPSRAWEMVAGGLVWLLLDRIQGHVPLPCSKAAVQWLLLAVLGGLLLVAQLGHWEQDWPGPLALAPVGWTALFLVVGAAKGSEARWITNRVVQGLGTASYSIYLWHWPVAVAIGAFPWLFPTPWKASLGGIAVSVLLGAASYRWVEKGLTSTRPLAWRSAYPWAVTAVLACLFGVSALYNATDGWVDRVGVSQQQYAAFRTAAQRAMPLECENYRVPEAKLVTCSVGTDATNGRVLVYGDSHAQHFYAWFDAHSETQVDFFTASGCPPVPGVGRDRKGYFCDAVSKRATLQGLLPEYRTIIVAGLWPDLDKPASVCFGRDGNCRRMGLKPQKEAVITALRVQWQTWLDAGKEVVVVRNTLQAPFYVTKIWPRALYTGQEASLRTQLIRRPDGYLQEIAAGFQGNPRFKLISVNDRLCPGGHCSITWGNGDPVFVDRDHLTAAWVRVNAFAFAPFVRLVSQPVAATPDVTDAPRAAPALR